MSEENDDVREDELNNTDEDIDVEDTEDVEEDTTEGGEDQDNVPDRYKKKNKTVSLNKHLKTKDKLKVAKERIAELEASKGDVTGQDLASIAKENGLEEDALIKAAKLIGNDLEKKIAPILEKQRKTEVDSAFEKEFNALSAQYPALATKKKQIKSLAFSSDYKESTLDEIASDVFGDFIGIEASETVKHGSDGGDDKKVDFDNLTVDEKAKIRKDPVLRKKYYKYLDTKGLNIR